MHRFSLSLLAVMVLASCLLAQPQGRCGTNALPPDVSQLIASKFPNWRIKLPSDLVAYDQELWAKAHPRECPGIAIGHFDAPERTAYGVLLVPKSGAETGFKIVVLSKSAATDMYSVRLLNHAERQAGSSSGLVISRVPPGKYAGFDETQSARLKLDGIEGEWIEKSSILYFWKNGRYRELQTSD